MRAAPSGVVLATVSSGSWEVLLATTGACRASLRAVSVAVGNFDPMRNAIVDSVSALLRLLAAAALRGVAAYGSVMFRAAQ